MTQKYMIDGLQAGVWNRVAIAPMSVHTAFSWIVFRQNPKAAQYDAIRLVRL